MSYQSFLKLAGKPSWEGSPLSTTLSSVPPVRDVGRCEIFEVPTLIELGFNETEQVRSYRGVQFSIILRLSSRFKKHVFAG